MSDDFFTNLQAVTSNIEDITFSRFATITSITGNYATVKEDESELEHTQVPLLNGVNLSVGDKVVLGFVDNSLYNPIIIGALDKEATNDSYSKTDINQFLDCLIDKLDTEDGDEQSGSTIDVEVDMIFDGVSGRDDSLTLRANIIYV